jgi:hypothetical protein
VGASEEWLMPVNQATWKVKVGGLWFEIILGNELANLHVNV